MIQAKLAVGVLSALASIAVLRYGALPRLEDRRFRLLLFGILLPGYLTAAWLLYGLADQPVPSDVHVFYVPQALEALRGRLVYRDFDSAYAPLFSYAGAALLALWHDARVFPVIAIALNALTLWLWLRVADVYGLRATARSAAALYAVSGQALLNVLVGQNQVWLAACVALAMLLALRSRPLASGAVLALGLALVKLLALVFVPPVWAASRPRTAWLVSFTLLAALSYGAFIVVGADVARPWRTEALLPSSGNLPFLLSALGLDPRGVTGTVSIIVGGLLGLAALRHALTHFQLRDPRAIALSALVLLVLMLFSRKSYANYLMLALFPLCHLVVSSPGTRTAYLLLCVLAPIEPSLWIRWYSQADLTVLWTWPTLGLAGRVQLATWLCIELALVGCYAALARAAYRAVAVPAPPQ